MIGKFFKNKNGKITIVQWPNIWVILWAGLTVLSKVADEELRTGIAVLATLSLVFWAYLEITDGDSMFRRVLGATVMIFVADGIIRSTTGL